MTKEETVKKESGSVKKTSPDKDKKPVAKKTTVKAPAKKATKKVVTKAKPRVAKKEVIKTHQTHAKDTGSSQVQIAVLTNKIEMLSDHLKTHSKDKHSRRGLIGMVGKRRKLLRYLQMNDAAQYAQVTKALGLRK
jgi:small subunit ribosomal protein S15